MRQGQQNKRMRGRNRKGPNPLTRSYESNGPDVKIRGTAHHIAEKYLSLARDAQSSGDRVAAESYLQHAEHYFRIIAAAQQQFAQQSPQMSTPDQPYVRGEEEDDDEPMQNDRFYSNIPPPPQFGQNNPNNGHPYRNGDSQPNYNGNHNRDQQGYANGNGSDAPQRSEQQPRAEGGSYDEAGFGGEPPAFVAGQGGFGGGGEQNFGQQGGQEGGNYRRRRRSGRDRQRFQDRGPDNAPPAGPANEGGGSDE
ncbi:MAG: DUF4167 domain-containing protein [Bauldia sp.]|nr:DUF4167 domain-containing protein [Bauldia sp.]